MDACTAWHSKELKEIRRTVSLDRAQHSSTRCPEGRFSSRVIGEARGRDTADHGRYSVECVLCTLRSIFHSHSVLVRWDGYSVAIFEVSRKRVEQVFRGSDSAAWGCVCGGIGKGVSGEKKVDDARIRTWAPERT